MKKPYTVLWAWDQPSKLDYRDVPPGDTLDKLEKHAEIVLGALRKMVDSCLKPDEAAVKALLVKVDAGRLTWDEEVSAVMGICVVRSSARRFFAPTATGTSAGYRPTTTSGFFSRRQVEGRSRSHFLSRVCSSRSSTASSTRSMASSRCCRNSWDRSEGEVRPGALGSQGLSSRSPISIII